MKLALRLPNDIHEDFLDEPPAGVPRDEPKIKTKINMDTNLFNLIDLFIKTIVFQSCVYDQHEIWMNATEEILDGVDVEVLQVQDDRGELLDMACMDQTRGRVEHKDAPDEMLDDEVVGDLQFDPRDDHEELLNGQPCDEPQDDNLDDLLGHDNQAQRIGILKEYKFRKLQVKTELKLT